MTGCCATIVVSIDKQYYIDDVEYWKGINPIDAVEYLKGVNPVCKCLSNLSVVDVDDVPWLGGKFDVRVVLGGVRRFEPLLFVDL